MEEEDQFVVEREERRKVSKLISEQGIIKTGGYGLYVLLGESGSGKNVCLQHQLFQATDMDVNWNQVLVVSQTQQISHQWDYLRDIFEERRICFRSDPKDVLVAHKQRVTECNKMFKTLEQEPYEEWLQNTARLVIIDDQAGIIDMNASAHNPYYNFIVTCRHVCTTVMLLVQFRSNTGPGFLTNCRAILSWASDEDTMKKVFSCLSMKKSSQELDSIQQWIQKKYHFCLFWKNWNLSIEKPRSPMYCEAVKTDRKINMFY